jgi:site-specific DNA recombinase
VPRAIIYCRTASAHEGSDFSLALQADRCRAYCERLGYQVIEVITDAGYSGNTLERPGLTRLRALVATGKIDAVVTLSTDRLTRRVDHWFILYEEFLGAGVPVFIVNETAG